MEAELDQTLTVLEGMVVVAQKKLAVKQSFRQLKWEKAQAENMSCMKAFDLAVNVNKRIVREENEIKLLQEEKKQYVVDYFMSRKKFSICSLYDHQMGRFWSLSHTTRAKWRVSEKSSEEPKKNRTQMLQEIGLACRKKNIAKNVAARMIPTKKERLEMRKYRKSDAIDAWGRLNNRRKKSEEWAVELMEEEEAFEEELNQITRKIYLTEIKLIQIEDIVSQYM